MGGKKKTKWRKLPLDETVPKYCPKLHERRRSEAANEENVKEQEISVPGENSSLNVNPEYNENQDGVWYPTHYLIYNPVPMYSNYYLPSDTYYYLSNDALQVPYQEYIPSVKDTIYLLFPTSALRPPRTSSIDWRRRRYGGYAEYAIIPEKNNTDEKEKKERSFKSEKCNFQSPFFNLKHSNSNKPDVVHMKAEKISELKNNMELLNGERNNCNKAKKSDCGVHSPRDVSLKSEEKEIGEDITKQTREESFENKFCETCRNTEGEIQSKISSEYGLYPEPDSCIKIKDNFMQTSLPDILNISDKMLVPHCTKSSNHFSITTSARNALEDNATSSRVSNTNGTNQEISSKPSQMNSSIYKLAFDEDQSDSESPIDPESQMPSSLVNHEINIYEADSGDEAGSEDLELIPHRYESESFLTKSKHVYENKLSLAVELLRTKESLPYDSQFKRVSEDQDSAVNLGFVDGLLNSFKMKNAHKLDQIVITNQCQTHMSLSPSFEIPLENPCEIADEAVPQAQQGSTDEVKAGYRGARLRHYFSPTSSLLNPWNCCILM